MTLLSPELVGVRESVSDQVLMLSAETIPMLSLLGFSDEKAIATKHTWYEDEMFLMASTLDEAIAADDTLEMTVKDAEPFRKDQVVKVDDELILVTNFVASTKVATITRGYAGSVAAAHDDESSVEVQYNKVEEGQNARAARSKVKIEKDNYTQIFDDTIDISGTAAEVSVYGVDDLYEAEKVAKQKELAIQLEKTIINGIKYTNGTDERTLGGIRATIVTNVLAGGGTALTNARLNAMVEDVWNAGGFESGGNYAFIAPANQIARMRALDENGRTYDQMSGAAGAQIGGFISDLVGFIPVTPNKNMSATEIFLVDLDRMEVMPLGNRTFAHTYLGKVGDSEKGQVLGEYTLKMVQEKAHAKAINLLK